MIISNFSFAIFAFIFFAFLLKLYIYTCIYVCFYRSIGIPIKEERKKQQGTSTFMENK